MALCSLAQAQSAAPAGAPDVAAPTTGAEVGEVTVTPWLDRTQTRLHETLWRTARRIDSLFGPVGNEWGYERTSGSIAPALLWDEFDGFSTRMRFRVDVPLPRLDDRFAAFLGRVNRDEYVTERAENSGAFPRQYGPVEDDETLFGVAYREPWRKGWRFSGGAGVRVRFPLDPYVKGSYTYEYGAPRTLLFSFRETLFWQNTEKFGLTSRIDLTRVITDRWLLRWTGSGTFSERTEGMRGYSTLTALRAFPNRRALALQIGADGETDALVDLHEYGAKIAWRQSVLRDWLVLEVRSSLTYPKVLPEQSREPSWGVGVGFEMYLGTDEFSAQPVTF